METFEKFMLNGKLVSVVKNRYLLGKLLGSGTCGEVYSVEDLKGEHHNIALKMSIDTKSFGMEIRVMHDSF